MPPTDTTTPYLFQANALADRLTKLTAQHRAGHPQSITDFVDVKKKALFICNQVEASSDTTDDDQRAADKSLMIAEAADARAHLLANEQQSKWANSGPLATPLRDPFGIDTSRHHQGNTLWEPRQRYSAEQIAQLPDGGFRGLGDFLASVRDAKTGQRHDERLNALDFRAGQLGSDDPSGGFLVPEQYQAQLIESADEVQPWLRLRNEFIARTDSVKRPILADRDRSGGEVGGFKLRRSLEGQTITDDAAVFEAKRDELSKAAGLVYASNELMQDSAIGMDMALRRLFGRAIAMLQADDFVRGTGVGEPQGVLTSDALYTVAKETGQDADTIVYGNVLNMRARCRVYERAIWLSHPSALPQIAQLNIVGGTASTPIWQTNAQADVPDALLGRPLYFTESCELLGDKGDLLLVVPGAYTYITKPIRIDLSGHVKFDSDQTAWRVIMRDAGGVDFNSTLTDARGFEQSEIITLAERA